MIDRVKELAANYSDEVVAIRRHLHQHPELSFVEFETSKYIQSKLDEWGITYEAGMVKTGIRFFLCKQVIKNMVNRGLRLVIGFQI